MSQEKIEADYETQYKPPYSTVRMHIMQVPADSSFLVGQYN